MGRSEFFSCAKAQLENKNNNREALIARFRMVMAFMKGTLIRQKHQTNNETRPKHLLTVLILWASFSVCVAQTEKYPLQRGDEKFISELSWSPKNDLILTSSDDENALRLWDIKSARLLWKADIGFLQDDLELYAIRHSAWTNDQQLILTGNDNGKLQLWNATNGKLIWNIKAHAGSVTAVAISPDAKILVSAG